MKWKNLQMPKNVEVDDKVSTNRYGKFSIEPLERCFGVTLGNALRRGLLSSLPGAAVTAVKIDGVQHEFSTMTGIKEDVPEILLNLKQMRFKIHSEGPKTATFEARGAGDVKAGDLKTDPDIELLNPELHIATLNKDGEFRAEVEKEVDEEFLRIKTLLERSVEELELSVRSSNCLKAADIKTIGDLVTKSEGEMLKYRNFGRKSLKEIADILGGMGLNFGMDVSKYKLGEKIE